MILIDFERGLVIDDHDHLREPSSFQMDSHDAFALVTKAWLRVGWDTKYVYSFTWLGRPVIQLPDDLIRIQEVIFQVQPDVIIETGIAHGGSLIFYASLCKAMGKGRVIGVDIEIRPHNRQAIEAHFLSPYLTLIEGDSAAPEIVAQVQAHINPGDRVLILLDSNHSKAHVLAELNAYAPLVTPGSYIVATDGIMQDLVGAPRSQDDWSWNNPQQAALEFVSQNPDFVIEEPPLLFNEGETRQRVTYWPQAYIRRIQRD
jgi:cephalosporin hydroxylase